MSETPSPDRIQPPPHRGWRTSLGLAALACAPALLVFAQHERWDWLGPFLGRFHPLVLHFPIALLLLAGLLEIVHIAARGRFQFPLPLLLFLGGMSAVAASALGWLHMRADAVEGALVDRHMRGGVAVAALAVVAFAVRLLPAATTQTAVRWTYRGLLFATCALLVPTAHDGGTLTHGEGFLSEHAPWRKPVPPPEFAFPTDQPVAQWDMFAHVVTPILQTRCYECHSGQNIKAGLVLDQFAALERGGKTGPALFPGRPDKSLLFQRLELPLEHKEHMPPRRKPQPTPDEIALLRRWIALGAPAEGTLAALGVDTRLLAVAAQLPAVLRATDVAPADALHELDPAAVAKLRADFASQVERLQSVYPHVLAYESRQSASLRLNASVLGPAFGDDDLVAFAPVAERIHWADFSGTAITDRSAATLASMRSLRVLRLARTTVTDASADELAALDQLESLNLYATPVTAAALPALARLRALQRLYVGETRIAADASCPEPLRDKIHFEVRPQTIEPKVPLPLSSMR